MHRPNVNKHLDLVEETTKQTEQWDVKKVIDISSVVVSLLLLI